MEISDTRLGRKTYIIPESSSSFEIYAVFFSYNALLPNNGENQTKHH